MTEEFVQRLREAARDIQWEMPLAAERESRAADLIEAQQAEIERLRAAIDAVLAELGTDHQPNSDGRGCIWCFPRDGSWPCVHRMVLDELNEARRG